MRMDIESKPQFPKRDASSVFGSHASGEFFSEFVALDKGRYKARVHLLYSEFAKGEKLMISVLTAPSREVLARIEVYADPAHPESGDEIYLSFETKQEAGVEFLGHAAANFDTHLFRLITILNVDGAEPSREAFFRPVEEGKFEISKLKVLNLGTTGVCNASCIHCPTNKLDRRMAHGRMSMEVFTKLIDELSREQFTGEIRFGLFGEPLDDTRRPISGRTFAGHPERIARDKNQHRNQWRAL